MYRERNATARFASKVRRGVTLGEPPGDREPGTAGLAITLRLISLARPRLTRSAARSRYGSDCVVALPPCRVTDWRVCDGIGRRDIDGLWFGGFHGRKDTAGNHTSRRCLQRVEPNEPVVGDGGPTHQ